MNKKNIMIFFGVVIAATLFIIYQPNVDSETDTSSETNSSNVDICRCLSEPGNTTWFKENQERCDAAIDERCGVNNWKAVSNDPKVSATFDRLAIECGF